MKLVLDTSAYADYAEGLPETVDFIANHGQQLFIPAVVLGELHYAFMKGRRQAFNERKLHQFMSRLKVEIIHVDLNVARKYGLIYLSLERRGTRIPINDVWIAACCMEAGGTLLTRDAHYNAVDQIDKVILPIS